MKTALMLALLLSLAFVTTAQEAPAAPPPPDNGQLLPRDLDDVPIRPPMERRRQGGAWRRGPEGEEGENPPPPIDRWMTRVEQRNPEDVERLRQLREQDPEAFREELRRRIRERPDTAGSAQRGEPHSPEMTPAMKEQFIRLREAVKAYRESQDEEEKTALRAQAREALRTVFESSDAQRAGEIQRMETALAELKAQLQDHQERRDALIDEQLDRLLNRERGMPPFHRRGRSSESGEPAL